MVMKIGFCVINMCMIIILLIYFMIYSMELIDFDLNVDIFDELESQNTAPGPNIIFILADDFGWNDIGYNAAEIYSPNLNYLATHGIKLNNYYTLCICSASRGVILTGRYDVHNGLTGIATKGSRSGVNLDETLISEILKKNGNYSTYAIGKWHIGGDFWEQTPTHRGFDYFYGHLGGQINYFTKRAGGDVFDFSEHVGQNCNKHTARIAEETYQIYSTNVMSQKAVDIIETYNKSNPFYIYLAFNAIHSPPQAPIEYINKYREIIKNPWRRTAIAMIDVMDEGIGNITKILRKRNLLNNTIIIFTSDNGAAISTGDGVGGSNYPLRGAKHSIYEGGTKVPALIYYGADNFQYSNRKYQQLFHSSDWVPTLLDAARINKTIVLNKYGKHQKLELDGISHWKYLFGDLNIEKNKTLVRNYMYYGYDNPSGSASHGNSFGLRYGKYKLLLNGGGKPDLWYKHRLTVNNSQHEILKKNVFNDLIRTKVFDIEKDPNETMNIFSDFVNNIKFTKMYQAMMSRIQLLKEEGIKNKVKIPAKCITAFVPLQFINTSTVKFKGGIIPGCSLTKS